MQIKDLLDYPADMPIKLLDHSNPFLGDDAEDFPLEEITGHTLETIRGKKVMVLHFSDNGATEIAKDILETFLSCHTPAPNGNYKRFTTSEILGIIRSQSEAMVGLNDIHIIMKARGYQMTHDPEKGVCWMLYDSI